MAEYAKVGRDVCEILDPSYRSKSGKGVNMGGRKKRALKV
jgi:hypothetical protein